MTGWPPTYPYPAGVPGGGYEPPLQQYADPLVSPTYGGWWNRGVDIVRRGWQPLAVVQGLGVVLALLLQAPLAVYLTFVDQRLTDDVLAGETTGQVDWTPIAVVMGLGLVSALLSVVVSAIVTTAVVHVGASVAVGAPVRIGAALRLAVRRAFPLIGWQLLTFPLYFVAFCLCVLPVFYVLAVFTVLPVVVAVERTSAISRSFSLFHRDLGASAGRVATIIGLSIGVTLLGSIVGVVAETMIAGAAPGTGGTVVGVLLSTLISAVLTAAVAILIAPLTLAAYADMRARVEPVNATMIAQELGILPPQAWSPAPAGSPTPPPATGPGAATKPPSQA
ncbi:hypothetical protein [Asanoa siamensis]|uniref:Glycerophosphoryl diester phosphodiesterase membrane domain-containing protein n=1 Tax=Asanoa siamensis TaxID=926357 RepID=A0ABQ4CJV6_9ACTN|nr:hypothetical protein [Asanoa siamensis]GIF71569.1 hypothetical protein Asi02nite_10870 [Asanoa siamensis]